MARKVTARADLLSEAQRLGIETDYRDARGRRCTVSAEAIRSIVRALRDAAGPARAPVRRGPAPVAVRRAYQGAPGRRWLIAAQLYGVRSRRNWGHGDFSDLRGLIELAADLGAAGIGINPLHNLFDDQPDQPSPYSPNSRLFLNPLYIDLEQVPEFEDCRTADFADEIEHLRQTEFVDYVGVTDLKQRCLRACHQSFISRAAPERHKDFESFRRSRGACLARFASFEVLRHRMAGPWWEWPAEWRSDDGAALARLRTECAKEIGFHEYVQWIADRQLMRCRERARQLGLRVGLYLDVAVGVRAEGFDAWNTPDAIERKLAIGAPPDLLNAAGQNWGLAGFSGVGLQARDFRPYGEMLRASMRYAGAIRLDHVLGLKRLYLIPGGLAPDQGAYVGMPFEQLLAVTANESAKNRCIVIGEDLGTVPDGFRDQVARYGVWSYKVMLFERDRAGAFLPPETFAERSLVTFSTHDLPTFTGWLSGHDLAVRGALDIPSGESAEERQDAIRALGEALRTRGMSDVDFTSVVNYLAATPAKLLSVGLEDVLEVREQANMPGTIEVHPNWRRKLTVEIERMKDDPRLQRIARIAADNGRAVRPRA